MKNIKLVIEPRKEVTLEEFNLFPPYSIALDGYAIGGPHFDKLNKNINFDHHSGVVREATMSTAMQVFLAIKQGLFDLYPKGVMPTVYINDCDQDTSLAIWLLDNHHLFEGGSSIPNISRILNLSDKLDITAGAYPVNLSSDLMSKHCWVFKPYSDFRTSGRLYNSDSEAMLQTLELIMNRLNQLMMGQAGECELDTRHTIIFQDHLITMVHEIGGNDARYFLYSQGMKAHISLVSIREDGRFVYSIGRKSKYIDFDLKSFFILMNEMDTTIEGKPLPQNEQAGGSDLIGGSSRIHGSSLSWDKLIEIYNQVVAK